MCIHKRSSAGLLPPPAAVLATGMGNVLAEMGWIGPAWPALRTTVYLNLTSKGSLLIHHLITDQTEGCHVPKQKYSTLNSQIETVVGYSKTANYHLVE